jgi:hypothetical protein
MIAPMDAADDPSGLRRKLGKWSMPKKNPVRKLAESVDPRDHPSL